MTPEPDTYSLPPTQSLVLEVLAARARLGETHWTFSTRHRPALEALATRGLLWWKSGIVEKTCMAWLTDAGREAVFSPTYTPPVVREQEALRLLEEALHIRMHGERAPGGTENWADWDTKAETFLRSLDVPPQDDDRRGNLEG